VGHPPDPVDGMDPSGNEDIVEYALTTIIQYPQVHWDPNYCGWLVGNSPLGRTLPPCGSPLPVHPGGPPPGHRCYDTKCTMLPHVVKDDNDTTPFTFISWLPPWFPFGEGSYRERYSTYHAYELKPDGTLGDRDTVDNISLLETSVSGSDKGICKPKVCAGNGPTFMDDQKVDEGSPFTIRRDWSLAGFPVPVWNPVTSSPAAYEILHLQFKNPSFTMEYSK
jgi:hypothetical protein